MLSHHESEEFVVDQSDCCGNGCANCILDVKPKQSDNKVHAAGKKNILNNYTKCKLINKNAHTPQLPDILELHFSCAETTTTAEMSQTSDYILDIPAGHHIMMRVEIPEVSATEGNSDNNKFHLRPYSPYWMDVRKMEFKILVNLKAQGLMSRYISNMRIDDEVEFRGPIGAYTYDEMNCNYDDVPKYIYLITQGVAVAPTIPIIEQILNNDDDMSRVFHLSCFTDLAHIYFRQSLHNFNRYWNYKGRIYLSHQNCGSAVCTRFGGCSQQCETFVNSLKYKEIILAQRLNAVELEEVCRTVNGNEQIFIIAGSREFQNSVVELIKALEVVIKKESIYLL